MYVDDCLNGELIEEYYGGHATVFRSKHKGRLVAVKIVPIYLTSDIGDCFSVNISPHAHKFILTTGLTEILSRSCCVEASPTPEHLTVAWCELGAAPARNGV